MTDFTDAARSMQAVASGAQATGGAFRGVTGNDSLAKAAALISLIGGGAQVFTGLTEIANSIRAIKAAEGAAHIAKWSMLGIVGGVAVAAAAAAVGYAVAEETSRYTEETHTGDFSTDAGRRSLVR